MDQIENFLKEFDIYLSAEFKNDLAIKFNGKFKYLKDKISLDALGAFYYPIVLWNQKINGIIFVVIGDKFDFFFKIFLCDNPYHSTM